MIDFGAELLQILDPNEDETEYRPPHYETRGRIIVDFSYVGNDSHGKMIYEYDVLDYDGDSGVFWIQGGIGFDYFFENYCAFPHEGRFLIKDVYGTYHRGTWGFDDDDEEWYHGEIVPTELETLVKAEENDSNTD